jgi:hypothetical protein
MGKTHWIYSRGSNAAIDPLWFRVDAATCAGFETILRSTDAGLEVHLRKKFPENLGEISGLL